MQCLHGGRYYNAVFTWGLGVVSTAFTGVSAPN